MPSLKIPLTEAELSFLDNFLRRHMSETKKSLNLTEVHGFLTALLTAPGMVYPSQWLLKISNPAEGSDADFRRYQDYLSRLINQIEEELKSGLPFKPILFDKRVIPFEQASWELIQQWAEWYVRGAAIDPFWKMDGKGTEMLIPFSVLADKLSLVGFRNPDREVITDNTLPKITARTYLPEDIASLYVYWEHQRTVYDASLKRPIGITSPFFETYDLCRCGSGKEFKACCGGGHRYLH